MCQSSLAKSPRGCHCWMRRPCKPNHKTLQSMTHDGQSPPCLSSTRMPPQNRPNQLYPPSSLSNRWTCHSSTRDTSDPIAREQRLACLSINPQAQQETHILNAQPADCIHGPVGAAGGGGAAVTRSRTPLILGAAPSPRRGKTWGAPGRGAAVGLDGGSPSRPPPPFPPRRLGGPTSEDRPRRTESGDRPHGRRRGA